MISELEYFHGAVFARMLHVTQQTMMIAPYSEIHNASYIINASKGVYIKYCSNRMSPWRFSFPKRHNEMILEMKRDLAEVFVILVCNDDGAVVLTFEEFQQVVKSESDTAQWISAARNRREMYLINGSDRKLEFEIGKDDFSEKIFGLKSRNPD
jgi:ADP-dependent phosphofructokinase/glucokinase